MKKRKNNYQPPRNMPPRIPDEPSPSMQNKKKDEGGFWLVEFVKFLTCGPKKDNPKLLTSGVCLRRFFIVLDNLIAAALLYYVLTWIKFYSNGADTSFDVIIDDMSTLCLQNVVGYIMIIIATWRWLYDSDSLPCLKNFAYREPYNDCFLFILVMSVGYFLVWLRMLAGHGFDIDSISQPIGDEFWYKKIICDYLPYWAQEIRIVIVCVVYTVRRSCLIDFDMKYGRKIFEKKSSKLQQTTDAQENINNCNL